MRCIVACGSASFPWLEFFFAALPHDWLFFAAADYKMECLYLLPQVGLCASWLFFAAADHKMESQPSSTSSVTHDCLFFAVEDHERVIQLTSTDCVPLDSLSFAAADYKMESLSATTSSVPHDCSLQLYRPWNKVIFFCKLCAS